MIKELIIKNRSYRRFYQEKEIDIETLKELIDLGRLSASGRNIQALRYIISNKEDMNKKINECIVWGGYYKDWITPKEGDRPSAYIVVVSDTDVGNYSMVDEGIAAQNILLGAVEKGLGGCIIKNINKVKLKEVLNLNEKYEIAFVLPLGYPKEEVVIEEINSDGDIKYWRDNNEVHHVPKRKLEDIIIDVIQ